MLTRVPTGSTGGKELKALVRVDQNRLFMVGERG